MIIDKRKIQTQTNYSTISQIYNEDFGSDYEHFDLVEKVVNQLRELGLADLPVVDLGSGPGVVGDFLSEKGMEHIKAVDISPNFCEMIESKHKDNIEIICEDMVEYLKENESASVGAYIANYSIIHIPDEEIDILFENITRTLVNNGLFLMSCHKGSFKGMEQEPYQKLGDDRLQINEKLEMYMNYFLEDELKNRIEKAGLKIISINTFEPKIVPGEISASKIWVIAQK